jgi:Rad3-related DNA helicase
MGNRFLFMSSTILDYEGFCRDLGIDPDDAVFYDVGSEFPPAHRTVVYDPKARMSYGWDQDKNITGRRRMVKEVYAILDRHKDESGIIHTGSFKMAKWLIDEIKDDVKHKIFHHNKINDNDFVDRNDEINEFLACKTPAVLISPSSTEGLDLKDELARFAIFIKVPFASLQDQWVKRRMELSNEWYQRQALINIIQGGGRIVRSKEDWGVVYILDESWSYLFRRSFRMIPKWWMDSYNK